MSKILAVFGATGNQGRSIIDYVLHDAELSQKYTIRAITRDVDSEKARQLRENVEVIRGDALDPSSLEAALSGAHTVFAMTTPDFGPNGLEVEYEAGRTIADAAVASGAQYIIFSTLPSASAISGGKYAGAIHFDAKAKAERYIRGLGVKSAFISPGFFMSNFHTIPFLAPRRAADGTWVMTRHNSPDAKMPMIDAAGDTGKLVGAVLADPDKYAGKTLCAATALYSNAEIAAALSKATGEVVVYKQISLEEFEESLPFGKDVFPDSFSYPEEFGYYGAESEGLVAWAAGEARGRPVTFGEYLEKHPLVLA